MRLAIIINMGKNMKKYQTLVLAISFFATVTAFAENLSPITIVSTNGPVVGPFSPGVIIDPQKGKLLFISGQVAINPKTGQLDEKNMAQATNQVLDNIETILKNAGSDWQNVVRMDIFLKDMTDLPELNKEYAKRFSNNFYPARQAVQVGMKYRVEISAIAFVPESKRGS